MSVTSAPRSIDIEVISSAQPAQKQLFLPLLLSLLPPSFSFPSPSLPPFHPPPATATSLQYGAGRTGIPLAGCVYDLRVLSVRGREGSLDWSQVLPVSQKCRQLTAANHPAPLHSEGAGPQPRNVLALVLCFPHPDFLTHVFTGSSSTGVQNLLGRRTI